MGVTINDNTEEVLEALKLALENGLEACGIDAEAKAVLNIENNPRRVDTGLLRNSITHAIAGKSAAKSSYSADDGSKSGSYSGTAPGEEGKSVIIGTNVSYAGYVHDGTTRMAPNRFLANAANDKDRYKQIIQSYLEEAEVS